MRTYLVICALLAAMMAASIRAGESGLSDSSAAAPPDTAPANATPPEAPSPDATAASLAPEPSKSCPGVSFSRNLKYGESDLNVLDVATGDSRRASPHPVLLLVAGDSFAGESGMASAMDPIE